MLIKIEAIGSDVESDRVLDDFVQMLRHFGNIEKVTATKVGGVLSIDAEIDTAANDGRALGATDIALVQAAVTRSVRVGHKFRL